MAQVRVKLELDGMIRVRTALGGGRGGGGRVATGAAASGGGGGGQRGMRPIYNQWAKRYEGFTRRRFNTYSRGGGDWKPLALSTILKRRSANRRFKTRGDEAASIQKRLRGVKRSKDATRLVSRLRYLTSGRGVTILKDSGILFQSLSIGQFGNLKQDLANGVRYGFAPAPHKVTPVAGGGEMATVSAIAGWHNVGGVGGRPPRRQILAVPDQQTVQGMMSDLSRGIRAIAKGTT